MSRGLSDQQNRILDYINLHTKKEPITFETLRWDLGELDDVGNLTRSSNNSLRRATMTLEKNGLIRVEERKLTDFESCVLLYPDKTLKGSDRKLRRLLLPTLLEWINENGDRSLKYGQAENEEHFVSQMPEMEFQAFSDEWSNIEDLLRPTFAQCSRKNSDQVLHLICRGKRLFEVGGVTSHLSLLYLIQKVTRDTPLSDGLSKKINSFGKRLFPNQEIDKMKFHSQIHSLVDISRHRPYELLEDTIRLLQAKHQEVVNALSDRNGKEEKWRFLFQVKYDKSLMRLFNNGVFSKFKYLSLA